jgi:hypothetical protein
MMMNCTAILRRAALALALTGLAGAAVAGPSYHVSIDTSNLASWGQGELDLTFANFGAAPSSTATISHLSGAFADLSGPTVLHSDLGFDELLRSVQFGGTLGFDVAFDGDFLTTSGDAIGFGVALFDSDFTTYLNAAADLADFTLANGTVTLDVPGQGITVGPVAAVPEASQWALFLTGLVLLGAVTRRQRR